MASKPYKMWRKFHRDPVGYCLDSKHNVLRRMGLWLFENQTRDFKELGAKHADTLITVIMTVYNTGAFVEKAVRSVLMQTHKNFELLIIDDASSDDTLDVLKKLAAEDSRIQLFHSPANHGTYWSKNWCLKEAEGMFVTFHDSDDYSETERLQTQLGAMVASGGKTAVTCRWQRVDTAGNPLEIDGQLERMAAISLMFNRRDVLAQAGYFDTVRIAADSEYIMRLTKLFGIKQVLHMRQMLYTGLVRDGSLTTGDKSGLSWQSDDGIRFSRKLMGDRLTYHQSFENWHHAENDKQALFVDFPQGKNRKFPAPEEICRNCDDMDTAQVLEVSR